MNISKSNNDKSLSLLIDIWSYITPKRKWQIFWLSLLMLLSGFCELFSLAAVIPLLTVLSQRDLLAENGFIEFFIEKFSISNYQSLLIVVVILFSIVIIFSAIIRLVNIWLNGKMAALIGNDLSTQAYEKSLYQNYEVHIGKNSSEIITAIAIHINVLVVVVNNFLQVLSSSIVILNLLIGIFIVDIYIASFSIFIFSFAYILFASLARRKLTVNSKFVAEKSAFQLQSITEGLSSIRDVILGNHQSVFVNQFRKIDYPIRQARAQSRFIGLFPKFTLEALGLLVIASFALVLSINSQDISLIIPIIGTIALAAQKILPTMQQAYNAWAGIRSNLGSIIEVIKLLKQPTPNVFEDKEFKKINIGRGINLSNISFSYKSNSKLVLSNINLKINEGEFIGFIGKTGSGKSTLIDLIMGLLVPSRGNLFVDDIDINNQKNINFLNSWRSSIGHVPQNIYLGDYSIYENIAFGIEKKKIDIERVKIIAKIAKIDEFVESLNDSYETKVGERGIKLSGGQKQRIGIARALYKNSSLLVFDEATSALDSETEKEVIENLFKFKRNLTVIMIAHRISTLKNCNRVVEVINGKIHKIIKGSDL